jgi:hypothetical protein
MRDPAPFCTQCLVLRDTALVHRFVFERRDRAAHISVCKSFDCSLLDAGRTFGARLAAIMLSSITNAQHLER